MSYHRDLKVFYVCLILTLLLGSCASKHPRPVYHPSRPGTHTAGSGTKTEGPVPPPLPTPSPIATPSPSTTEMEMPHVALVLGGAGIASFATVGILKRFHEEGIKVDFIVTTGWPTLFALADGYMRSVHDVEWFAMRLKQSDFYKAGVFGDTDGYASEEKLTQLVEGTFHQKDLGETKVPIIVSATNTDLGESEIYDRGDWKIPLLKTMSVPGIFRPYPQSGNTEWITSVRGLDVDEALRRGAKTIVAVDMYDDYLRFLRQGRGEAGSRVFRKLYSTQLRKSIAQGMKAATVSGKIVLNVGPTDFTAKRLAIFQGYHEAAQLAAALRSHPN